MVGGLEQDFGGNYAGLKRGYSCGYWYGVVGVKHSIVCWPFGGIDFTDRSRSSEEDVWRTKSLYVVGVSHMGRNIIKRGKVAILRIWYPCSESSGKEQPVLLLYNCLVLSQCILLCHACHYGHVKP